MQKGTIYSICIAPERGQLKKEVPEANVIENFGIENDGHAGDWGRQITCLNQASVEKVNREKNMQVGPGEFAENILIAGIDDLVSIGVGGKLKLGSDVVLEVSQIGKEDHPSVVTRTLGVTLLPYEGLFCRVLHGGKIKKGDTVEVID
ncbi:MAG: MOSC domain-containing protein [Syntrophomonadaceae bacterium]